MNHELIIETEVEGAEPYADLLRQVIPAALEAEGVAVPWEVDVLFTDDEGQSPGGGVRPRHPPGGGLSGCPFGAPPAGVRPHGRGPHEGPDAGA